MIIGSEWTEPDEPPGIAPPLAVQDRTGYTLANV